MKLLFFTAFSVTLLLLSCKKGGFLDETVTTSLNEGTTFSDSVNAMAFLNNIYTGIGFATDPKRFGGGGFFAGLEAASDEAEGPNASSANGFIQFATGTVNANIVPDDVWRFSYANIRAVNQFLKHLPAIPFNATLKAQTKAEARFLRAWYYTMLLQHYGGVPLIGDAIFNATDPIPARRSSYRACVEYIIAEAEAAAQDLPVKQSGSQYGRVSRGACMALKARVLLFAASPLFNDGGQAKGMAGLDSIVAYPDVEPDRWRQAAKAARDVIALNAFSLYYDSTSIAGQKGYGFQRLFTQRFNDEYILARMMDINKYLESIWDAPSRGGAGGPFPYQEIVDAFPMANGKEITDPTSGFNPAYPYQNRDPRLGYSILHDSSLRKVFAANQPAPLALYINTGVTPAVPASGDAVYRGTPTGYYIFKMVDPGIINNDLASSARVLPLMRFAEVLLNFAEATNEADGPTPEVYQAVEALRRRAGLRPYELQAGLSKEKMRDIIRKERRIELAFEGHRFFDVRRWLIADETENKLMHGLEVNRNGAQVSYKRFEVRKHNFSKAMYLWPLPMAEIAKSPESQQNPHY